MRFALTALVWLFVFIVSGILPDSLNATHYILLMLWSMLLTSGLFAIYKRVGDCPYKLDPILIIISITSCYFVYKLAALIDYEKEYYILYDYNYAVQDMVNFLEALTLLIYGGLEWIRFMNLYRAEKLFWQALRSL